MRPRTTYIIILVLFITTAFFGVRYFATNSKLRQADAIVNQKNVNEKVLTFSKLFIEKVLKSDKEVDFETRLQLENSVRDLDNPAVLAQWQKFTNSKTEAEAQIETKNLLQLLVNEIGAK